MQPATRREEDSRQTHPAEDGALRSHLEEILRSEAFSGAWRQQRLLRYLVEKHLEGRDSDVKEYCIAVEVFDKAPDFDPRLNPIVRVEASRLRSRLERFYQTAGKGAELRIELPRGAYVLRIHRRQPAARALRQPCAGPSGPPVTEPAGVVEDGRPSAPGIRQLGGLWQWAAVAAALVAVLLALAPFRKLFRGESRESALTFTRLTRDGARCTWPSLSPDGRRLIYTKATAAGSKLWLQDLISGATRPFLAGESSGDRHPAFSPDGRWVAFRSERDGGGIFLADVAGTSLRKLPSFGYHPCWSPDARFVAFSSGTFSEPEDGPARRGSGLYAVEVATGRLITLAHPDEVYDAVQPAWSPHGFRIAYWSSLRDGKRDVFTIPAQRKPGEALRPAPVTRDDWIDWSPAWAADGRHLYFASDRDGTMNLWRIALDEKTGAVLGGPQPVRTPSSYSAQVSVFSDGRGLVYTRRTISSVLHAAELREDGVIAESVRPLTARGRQIREPEVQPGGALLSVRVQDPQEDILLLRPDGSEVRRLTNDQHKDRNARWSPDGSYLVFLSNRGGAFEHWLLRPDGTGLRRIAPSVPLTWVPEGALVAYPLTGEPYCVVPAGGADCRPVRLPPGFQPMVWSPDGRFVVGRPGGEGSSRQALLAYSLRDGASWKLTDHGFSPVWLRDPSRLLYYEANQIWLADLPRRSVRRFFSPPGQILQQRFTLSVDGTRLYYVLTEIEEDIWMASAR